MLDKHSHERNVFLWSSDHHISSADVIQAKQIAVNLRIVDMTGDVRDSVQFRREEECILARC